MSGDEIQMSGDESTDELGELSCDNDSDKSSQESESVKFESDKDD